MLEGTGIPCTPHLVYPYLIQTKTRTLGLVLESIKLIPDKTPTYAAFCVEKQCRQG